MKILMVASEAVPFLRTSDVATVVTGLSKALHKQGHDVRIAIPRYRTLILDAPPHPIINEFDVPLGIYTSKACLWRLDYEGIPIYLVDNDFYFGREDAYGYLDDYERFIFFTRAVVEMLRNDEFAAAEQWHPDVIHGHDWIAGFIPWWLRYTCKKFFSTHPTSFVYTIHNADFPGLFGYRAVNVAGLEELGIYESIGEQPSRISFLARGILAANAVNTVSPRYAEEIKHEEYTRDLAKALEVSKQHLYGILNGLDYEAYNPAFDNIITYKFDQYRIHLRKENKRLLQEECGLIVDPEIPLLGFISRLISEKGVGLLEHILPTLLNDLNVQVVIVGVVGDYRYLEIFHHMHEKYKKQFLPVFTSLDDPLSRKLLGSADLMLIPSLREPCGLQQMLSMCYGAIPVVRRTGGLADTVASWEITTHPDIGKGFTFDDPDANSFLTAIKTALQMYNHDQEAWQKIQRHNMKVEFSWYDAAQLYTNLYKEASQGSQELFTLEREASEPIRPDRRNQLIKAILEGEELAITTDQSAYLKRVARTIRELLNGDAVLIWKWDEQDPQRLRPEGYSFNREKTSSTAPFNPDLYQSYTEQDSRSWQYVHRLTQENKEITSSLGSLESELARQYGWVTQLKVPMRTHGAFLGRIDIFTCDPSRDFTDEDKDLLSAFATSLAANLEKVRLSKETSDLLQADREIAQGQTVDDIARSILCHAKRLTHSNVGQLRFLIGQEERHYLLNEQNQFSGPTRNVNDEESGAFSMSRNSKLHFELTNAQDQSIGEMSIVKFGPMALSRNDEAILQSLTLQAATFLQAAYVREKEDKRRVEQISKLADSLFGGVDFNTLLQKVLATTAEVLQAKAASLYLKNEETGLFEIRAADGYHKPLLREKATYQRGEGTTGWIAQQEKTYRADSLMQLHNETPWKGKHKHLQGEIEPKSFLGIPLKVTDHDNPERQSVIGVLKLEDRQDNTTFTTQDERLGEMMANVIATVIQNERLSDTRLRELNKNLQTLSEAMVGGLEMPELVKRIVDTIAEVVGAEASSLYLIEPGNNLLKIQAATGYQEGLVKEGALYNLTGGGITAWIAREGKPFKASSVTELHQHSHWAGKHNVGQGGREPNAFLGIPLKVIATGGREETIGVLKVEDVRSGPSHPEAYFTEQDQLLVEMMGNIIATVIQNTRFADTRLRELNANLQTLSGAMVGGLEMPVLVQRIVDTIAEVVGADASSLYLREPGSDLLKIQAATGYQEGLVKEGASYDVQGHGITAWIAREGKSFKANSVTELRQHSHWRGKYVTVQGKREPNAFLGIPLKVIATSGRIETIGVLKVEDVRPSPRHPEPYFTEQDQLLVEMMSNVISTVIQNTRESEMHQNDLKKIIIEYLNNVIHLIKTKEEILPPYVVKEMMEILVDILKPKSALEVLRPFISTDDPMIIEALSDILINSLKIKKQESLKAQIGALAEQTGVLLNAHPKPELFRSLAEHGKDKLVKSWYGAAYELYQSTETEQSKILEALQLELPWQEAKSIDRSPLGESSPFATKRLASAIEATIGENAGPLEEFDEVGLWTGFRLPNIISAPDISVPQTDLPILFFKSSRMPTQKDNASLRLLLDSLSNKGIGNIVSVVSFLSKEEAKQFSDELREMLKSLGVASLFFMLRDIQRLVSAKDPRTLLMGWLLKQGKLLPYSAYKTSGPTPPHMFFGREKEIQEITQKIGTNSYAIMGGRRIGKTSLLKYLHEKSLPAAKIPSLYLDCNEINYVGFMNLTINPQQLGEETLPGFPTTFQQLLHFLSQDKSRVLLLDEAHKLIPDDQKNNWSLFSALRPFANQGQIVLGGERTLHHALQDSYGPLYNFAEHKLLGPLDRTAVERLVTLPMKQLQITLVDEKAIVDLIWKSTGGHPNVVQRLCLKLIELLDRQNARQVQLTDVYTVIGDPSFLRDDFLSTYWQHATVLEKIISLLMVKKGDKSYSLSAIRALLADNDIPADERDIKEALNNLETLLSLLKRDRTGYKFTTNAFPQVLAHTNTITDLLDTCKEELLQSDKTIAEFQQTPRGIGELVQQFLANAGFDCTSVPNKDGLHAKPKIPIWRTRFPRGLYVRVLFENPLDQRTVWSIYNHSKRLSDHALVIINTQPEPSGWGEINILRGEQGNNRFVCLPIDESRIQEGISLNTEFQTLKSYIDKYLGKDFDPYDVRDPVSGAVSFFGRQRLTEELLDALRRGQRRGLFGLHKMGKTSVLQELQRRAEFPVAYVYLESGDTLDRIYSRIIDSWAVNGRLKYPAFHWVKPPTTGIVSQGDFNAAAKSLLTYLGTMDETQPLLGVFLDEIEHIVPSEGDQRTLQLYVTLMDSLRGLQQETNNLAMLVAGVHPSIARRNYFWSNQKNPMHQVIVEQFLPPLDEDDCSYMIRSLGQQINLQYEENALKYILDMSGSHPFLARQICSHAYKKRRDMRTISVDVVEEVVQEFVRNPSTASYFDELGLWGELSELDLWEEAINEANHQLLCMLASASQDLSENELCTGAGIDKKVAIRSFYALKERSIISSPDNSGYYRITFGLFRNWIRFHQLGIV